MENKRPVMQYESDIWAIADYFISAGIKQSDFPKFMMPFFALVMLESRMRKVLHKIENEEGIKRDDPYFAEAFRDEDCGYNAFIVEKGKMLADICKSDTTFEQDFKEYLQGFDENIKMLLGINRGTAEAKFLNIEGIAGELRQKKILLGVVQEWAKIDLEPYDNSEITTLEEHIKRKWADVSAETAGEQYTPQDIIGLISDIAAMMISKPKNKYLHIYDPTCGGANLLFGVADRLNPTYPQIATYGSEWNDALFALASIESRFRDVSKISYGNTLTTYPFADKDFDVIVANPPYGTSWKGFQSEVQKDEKGQFKFFPATSDGQLLFMQHNLARLADDGICIEVHNGSSLFSGDAGGGESNIRKYMFDHDWVDAIIQMPSDEFFNTGIYTYLWIFNKNKPASHKDKVMLINASPLYNLLRKSMGSKRREINEEQRAQIVDALRNFEDCAIGKVYDKWHFYYNRQSLTLIESDPDCGSVYENLCDGIAPFELSSPKALTITSNNAGEDEGVKFDKFQKLTDEEFEKLAAALQNIKESDTFIHCESREEGKETYQYNGYSSCFIAYSGDEIGLLGKGQLTVKFNHQKKAGTHSVKFFIEPITQSDYEIIPFSPKPDENENFIQSFLDKYVTKRYLRRDNVIGVELSFNKEFYVPEELPAADEIMADITSLEKHIKSIEL